MAEDQQAEVSQTLFPEDLSGWEGFRGRRPLPPFSSACLIVVDLQRFFTEPGAPRFLPDWPSRAPEVRRLIDAFRARSLPVVATCHGHPPGDSGGTMGFFFDQLLRADDPWAAPDPAVGLPPEVPLFWKRRYSVFSVPAIEDLGRRFGTVVLVGVQTHRCILASAMDAARLEIRPVVVVDACAAGQPVDHRSALRVLAQGHAHVCTVTEVLDALRAGNQEGASGQQARRDRALENSWDLLVVGAGPAGISCALHARRDGRSVLVVGDEAPGGLLPAARRIDALPGQVGGISGRDLARRLADHLDRSGACYRRARVLALEIVGDRQWRAVLEDGSSLLARAVCLATGTRPVPLPWPGREALLVERDPRAWPDRLDGQRVVVIGGGEAALDGALTAVDRGASVQILARRGIRGCPAQMDEVRRRPLDVREGAIVETVSRSGTAGWEVVLVGGERLLADRVLACLGREPALDLLEALGPRAGNWRSVETPWPGIWMAGDVIRGRDRFVATAIGDGQRAAVLAGEWLSARSREGARSFETAGPERERT